MTAAQQGLTGLGKIVSLLFVIGLIVTGLYVFNKTKSEGGRTTNEVVRTLTDGGGTSGENEVGDATNKGGESTAVAFGETMLEVPALGPSIPYVPKDNIIDVELSEYAGYAGIIVANGGMEPNEDSYFFKEHGFKVRISLSEEESWAALNQGKMAASATTVDVLAVYGKQFQVVSPVQIGFSRGADGILVKSDIKRINALKGKTLVTSQFTEADFFIRYLAQEAGLPVHAMDAEKWKVDKDAVNLVYAEDAFVAGDIFLEDVLTGNNRLAGCVTWAPKTTEVVDASEEKARLLVSNKNLLVIADILIVNKPFAEKHPEMVQGLVAGVIYGNREVRNASGKHLGLLSKAFGWSETEVKEELEKVHLSNLPENLAFFSGAIDAAGSFGGIYQSAVYAYGKEFIPEPVDSSRFANMSFLQNLQESGKFAGDEIELRPIKSDVNLAVESNPLLSKDIRFFFEANSAQLDATKPENMEMLEDIRELLQVSPGSTVLLRGHVDNAMIDEFRKQGGDGFVRQMALKAMVLSKERAETIRGLLRQSATLDEARVEVVGRGWDEPVSDKSEENRRVEVQWFTVE